MPAGEREDGVDAAGAQPSGDQMSGVDRNWSLDAHGRSIIAAMSEAPETQVLIAGAGPIGMTAAIELARRGIACRIVDPLAEPPQYAKAVGVQPRTPVGEEVVGRTVRSAREGIGADSTDIGYVIRREAQLLINYAGSPIVAGAAAPATSGTAALAPVPRTRRA